MKKVLDWLALMLEILKSFLIMVLVVTAIFIALSSIIHNLFRIREVYQEDAGYKTLVSVDGNRMNVQVRGEGEKTIVILSDFGVPSPLIQYKTYVDSLASSYRVVVVEYFGYGNSLSTKLSRNNSKFVHEIITALESSNIYGPYTILANGTSSIYAYDLVSAYPENVERLVLVDPIYPKAYEEDYLKKQLEEKETNVTLTSYTGVTGFARILSYVKPDIFGIDKMQEYGFSKEDIKYYRKMIANRFYTKEMRHEMKEMAKNISDVSYYKFGEYLPVTQILTSEYVDEYKAYKKDNLITKDLEEYAEELITNSEIQKTVVIDSRKSPNIYNPTAVVEEILK